MRRPTSTASRASRSPTTWRWCGRASPCASSPSRRSGSPSATARNRYSVVAHGVGLCDEYPAVYYPEDAAQSGYDGVLEASMTICLESYVGEAGRRRGRQAGAAGPDHRDRRRGALLLPLRGRSFRLSLIPDRLGAIQSAKAGGVDAMFRWVLCNTPYQGKPGDPSDPADDQASTAIPKKVRRVLGLKPAIRWSFGSREHGHVAQGGAAAVRRSDAQIRRAGTLHRREPPAVAMLLQCRFGIRPAGAGAPWTLSRAGTPGSAPARGCRARLTGKSALDNPVSALARARASA